MSNIETLPVTTVSTTASGGSGNAINDLLTIGSGSNTGMTCQIPVVLKVTAITPSLKTIVQTPGACTIVGTPPYAVSGSTGSGTGETFNIVWSANP